MFRTAIDESETVTAVPEAPPSHRRIAPPLVLVALLAACGTADDGVNDPFEPVNRASHSFNKATDTVFFRPASQVYGGIVPAPVRTSLTNAAENLDTPRSIANGILQGDLEGASKNTLRFLLNTTLGVLGLFDPATEFGLPEDETGFGDTLAVWGVGEGPYLEVPIFGPSTARDALGLVADLAANPVSAILGKDGEAIAGATSLPTVLNSRYTFSDTFDSILYDSADSYTQLRLYYLDSRRFELSGEVGAADAFDPYEDLYEGVYDEF